MSYFLKISLKCLIHQKNKAVNFNFFMQKYKFNKFININVNFVLSRRYSFLIHGRRPLFLVLPKWIYSESSSNQDSVFCSMVRKPMGPHSRLFQEPRIRHFQLWRPLLIFQLKTFGKNSGKRPRIKNVKMSSNKLKKQCICSLTLTSPCLIIFKK